MQKAYHAYYADLASKLALVKVTLKKQLIKLETKKTTARQYQKPMLQRVLRQRHSVMHAYVVDYLFAKYLNKHMTSNLKRVSIPSQAN